MLDYLLHLNPFQGLTHGQQIVDYVLPLLIERKGSPAVPLQLKSSFIRLWTSLYSISPRKMCLLFFDRALKLLRLKDPHIYTHKVLQARPVLIFRIFEILVECPELTDVFLYIVRYYMIESSNYVYHLHANKLTSGETDKLNIETITDLQGAVIVQALLELCSVIPGQAQKICLFIHQIFIERSLLIKLVINQGFPIQLIPMSVDFIPSIRAYTPTHIRVSDSCTDVAIDFIPELLARSNERQKLFLLNLAAHLFKKYPIEKR